jgi:hypothetical protein
MLPLSVRAISVPPGRRPPAPGSYPSTALRSRGFRSPVPTVDSRRQPFRGCPPPTGFDLPGAVRFHSSRCSSRLAFSLAAPGLGISHSLAFCSLTPCEVGGTLWSACDPCSVRAGTVPPGRPPACARLLRPSPEAIAGWALWSDRFGDAFSDFRRFPRRRLHLAVPLRCRRPHNTAFDRFRRCCPTTCWVCTQPPSLRAGRYPLAAIQPAPGSSCVAIPCGAAFRLSAADFLPRRFSGSSRRASTSRFSGPRRPGDHSTLCHLRHAVVCVRPLLTVAQQRCLTAFHPAPGFPSDSVFRASRSS